MTPRTRVRVSLAPATRILAASASVCTPAAGVSSPRVKARYIFAGLSVVFTATMLVLAGRFPLGQMVNISSPADLYRFMRSAQYPAVLVAYGGPGGDALVASLAARAHGVPDGLFLAMCLERMLDRVPASAFTQEGLEEFTEAGMETIVLVFNRNGERRRWTAAAGPEAAALLDNSDAEADAIVAFMNA